MLYYEYRSKTRRSGSPLLLPEVLPMCSAAFTFRSVYGYPDETLDFIKKNGHTRNLKGKPIYSDVLLIDSDTDKEYRKVKEKLELLPFHYEEYHTGNRGGHFHIPIKPMWGTDVIYSQIRWLKEVGLWSIIDTSIYREGGIYRLIGAVHHKTKKLKTLVYTSDKLDLLEIPLVKPPKVQLDLVPLETATSTPEAKIEYALNLATPKSEGSRHMHFYIIWKRGLQAGLDPEQIKEDIRWYNKVMCHPPHTEHELEKKFAGFR